MRFSHMFRGTLLVLLLALVSGCASTVRTVPFQIQSDPLGATVLYQVRADAQDSPNYDWIFLGHTPLDVRRAILSHDLKHADSFVIRVMKDGFLDQHKSWTGEQIVKEAKTKGGVFWNPRLVPSG